jgi:hypothetical protein
MTEEPEIVMDWRAFAWRLMLVVVWMAASVIVGSAAADADMSTTARLASVGFVAGTAILWLGVLGRRKRKADEFDAELINTALLNGGVYALILAPLSLAITAVTTPAEPLHEAAFKLVCLQAPTAAFFGEWMAQHARWRFSRPGRPVRR